MTDPEFLHGGRSDAAVVTALRERFLAEQVMAACIEAMPELVLILNRQRQIIAVNARLLASLGLADPGSLLGSRPGEVLRCVHAHDGPDGCGTGRHCEVCGAALALAECQRLKARSVQECLMTIEKDGMHALELEVVAAPLRIDGEDLTLCAMRDIADQKRRQALERVFLHDVANTVAVISGVSELMRQEGRVSPRHDLLEQAVCILQEELNGQRALQQAEAGDLRPQWGRVDAAELLGSIRQQYASLADRHQCRLVAEPVATLELRSDAMLLRRALSNLVKNAIEATAPDGQVTLSAVGVDGGARFAVHNPAIVPDAIREQMFYRSFSTKGQGRGLGTYGAKLIGERYLGGRIAVQSGAGIGTIVTLWIPAEPPIAPG